MIQNQSDYPPGITGGAYSVYQQNVCATGSILDDNVLTAGVIIFEVFRGARTEAGYNHLYLDFKALPLDGAAGHEYDEIDHQTNKGDQEHHQLHSLRFRHPLIANEEIGRAHV